MTQPVLPTRRFLADPAAYLVLSMFGFFGLAFGTWLVLLAETQDALSLSPAVLGAALTGGLVVSVPSMPFAGRAVDRWGARPVVCVSAGVVGCSFAYAMTVQDVRQLFVCCFLFYGATAAFEVGINAAAIGYERMSGRNVMSYFHAAFSGPAALAALAIGSLLGAGVPYQVLYAAPAVLAGILSVGAWTSFYSEEHGEGPHVPAPNAPTPYRSPVVLLLAAVAVLSFMSEGEIGNWATVYLKTATDGPALIGTSGFAAFHLAMFAGRLLGGRATNRWGRRATLQAAGVSVATGMALALSATALPVVLAGFVMVGLSLSVVTPTAYSLAGDVAGEHTGAVTSLLTTVGYSGYLLGPVLVGGLAEAWGLRLALATISLAGCGIALLSSFIKKGSSNPQASYFPNPGVVEEMRP